MRPLFLVAFPTWLALLRAHPAAAQAGAGASWGRSSAYVAARLPAAAGFEQVASTTAGAVRTLSYGNVHDPTVGLVFTFRHDSLVALTRYVLVKNARRVAPDPDWEPLGPGTWALAAENTRLTRRVEGVFLRDDMRPLRAR
jgi:hypothetical protein